MRRLIRLLRMAPPNDNARRRSMPRWARRASQAAVLALMAAAYLGGVAMLTRNGWIDARLAEIGENLSVRIADAGFRVQSLRVHGVAKTELAELRDAMNIEIGSPILALDLETAQRRVENLPWVRVATVERSLPDKVVVRIVERQPLALWQRKGQVHLLDSTGTVVPGAALAAFRDLPLLAGEGVPAAAPQLMQLLNNDPGLAPRVTAGSYIEKRRWDLLLDDRVWVKLPQEKALEAWLRLASEDRDTGLLKTDILAVDVRNADQWVFRLPPGERTRMALEKNGG